MRFFFCDLRVLFCGVVCVFFCNLFLSFSMTDHLQIVVPSFDGKRESFLNYEEKVLIATDRDGSFPS